MPSSQTTTRAVFAAPVAGLGFLLLSARFIYVWAPLPKAVPGAETIAAVAGAVMLAGAAGLLWRKTFVPSAAILTLLFLSWLLLLQIPRIVGTPGREILWSGAGQLASIVAAGWILVAAASNGGARWVRAARLLYAAALVLFGVHHLADVAASSQAVPAWLPFRPGWVYLTAAGHIAAGVAIALGLAARLAATLEVIMITSFVLLVHLPGVTNAPTDKLQWTMLIVASAIGGAAWVMARSYADAPSR
jgi:uncharacterized membrane protein YphA (DoxX/SURF4 family)